MLNIAHRGGADLWPENTLVAFERAIAADADGIEFDLQLTADNRLVVHHDTRLKPDATRQGGVFLKKPTPRIADLTRAELAAYDVGRLDAASPYGKRRAARANIDGARIPDFEELCALVHGKAPRGFRLYAELKTEMNDDAAAVARLAEVFVGAIQQSELLEQTHIVSFDWRALAAVRAALPDMACSYTTPPFAITDPAHESAAQDDEETARLRAASAAGAAWWGGHDWRGFDGKTHGARVLRAIAAAGAAWWGGHDWRGFGGKTHGARVLRAIAAAGGRGWCAYWRDVTADTMALARELGIVDVAAWTVNDPADMQSLKKLGITALITDRPDIAVC